jgi:ribosylpyrimidine nucleosidase
MTPHQIGESHAPPDQHRQRGAVTDLALAFRKDPSVALLCKQIVVMGGSFSQGNVTEHAEFNAFADPEAASLVFSSGAKLVLFPLDCTRRVTLSPARLADFQRRKGRSTAVFCSCMESYTANYTKRGQGQPQMHDPLCVAYLVDPSKVETEYCRVEVDTNPGQTYGKTTKTPPIPMAVSWLPRNIDNPGSGPGGPLSGQPALVEAYQIFQTLANLRPLVFCGVAEGCKQ